MGTLRERIRDALREGPSTALELSQRLRHSEAEILDQLPYLRRSLPHQGLRLQVEPARCRKCGHVFEDRERPSKPSKCPGCRGSWIEPPSFSVIGDGDGEPES
jgi:hypothetical protein